MNSLLEATYVTFQGFVGTLGAEQDLADELTLLYGGIEQLEDYPAHQGPGMRQVAVLGLLELVVHLLTLGSIQRLK